MLADLTPDSIDCGFALPDLSNTGKVVDPH